MNKLYINYKMKILKVSNNINKQCLNVCLKYNKNDLKMFFMANFLKDLVGG